RLRRGQVHDEIESGRLLDWNVARLCPAQNLIDIVTGAAEQVGIVCSIVSQTSGCDVLSVAEHRRQSRGECKRVDKMPVEKSERVDTDVKCFRTAFDLLKSTRDVLGSPNFERGNFETERTFRRLNLPQFQHGGGIADIGHDRQPAEIRNNLAQKFESLTSKISVLDRESGDVPARVSQTRDETGANRVRCPPEDSPDHRCCPPCPQTYW